VGRKRRQPAAVTALYVAENGRFRQVAEIPQMQRAR
jgi:branched-chain amino acid transport system substrate-binding protein